MIMIMIMLIIITTTIISVIIADNYKEQLWGYKQSFIRCIRGKLKPNKKLQQTPIFWLSWSKRKKWVSFFN